jgi:hypothetical protein
LVRHLRGFWEFWEFWGEKKKKRKSERNRKETKNGGKKNRQNFCSNEVYKDVNIREGERIGIQY